MHKTRSATLLISAPDKEGLVFTITDYIFRHQGNILHAEQHIDARQNIFFMRIEWDLSRFTIPDQDILSSLEPIRQNWNMDLQLYFKDQKPRIAIFVSSTDHCLVDLLYKWKNGDLPMDIVMLIGNHEHQRSLAESFHIPFHFMYIDATNRPIIEDEQRKLLHKNNIDLIILARYMQILSPVFVSEFRNRIINVHHSFLPAFTGAKPYEQAFSRGVKIIGSTAHYVTDTLDDGPIIGQQVTHVSHKDSLQEFISKGKDLEKQVLSYAVKKHIDHKILVFQNKTVVFD